MIEIIISSSVLIFLLCVLRLVLKRKISCRLQYALWLLVVLRLIIPNIPIYDVQPAIDNPYNVMNAFYMIRNQINSTKHKPDDTKVEGITASKYNGVLETPAKDDSNLNIKAKEEINRVYIIRLIWFLGIFLIAVWIIFVNTRFIKQLLNNRTLVKIENYRLPVYVVEHLSSPCLYGILGKQAVYITPDVLNDKQQLKHVLVHEFCHYKQLDYLWAVVRCILVSIYWFNPFIWIAAILSKRDCELACDELVIKNLGQEERINYGNTLIALIIKEAKTPNYLSLGTTMVESKKSIKERIKMIAMRPKMLLITFIGTLAIIVVIVAVTFITTRPENNQVVINIEGLSEDAIKKDVISVKWTRDDMILAPDFSELYYASDDYIIFKVNLGLFIYDINANKIIRSLDLESIQCQYAEGDNYCAINVSEDGDSVYLRPISKEMMYVYVIQDNILYYQPFHLEVMADIEMFNDFTDTTHLDVKSDGAICGRIVELKDNETSKIKYGYLSIKPQYRLKDLRYITGKEEIFLFTEENQ
ncbi:M56 family metallopeptidase [Anaerocolumna aminovalerica]|uniref:M56 family metallopeptidase n=1 Tax=Anaerocolumna aminovalerica TaxID=1527 RepID=UPI001C0EBD30|nr:M56 family metallopeptidase [Anaerocolumna aminovalerica]MBU5333671.1 M56 family metallopeptidase [Anaerocolumna aminovalerica]